MGGGMFRVAGNKEGKIQVATVCLEHGKNDPSPRVKYKMIRLEKFNGDPKVAEVCKALGYGHLAQNTAQAAAWHFANGLSWQELANKVRFESQYTGVEMWFSRPELQNALRFAQQVEQYVNSRNEDGAGSRAGSDSEGN
jgi:hypothetical protein